MRRRDHETVVEEFEQRARAILGAQITGQGVADGRVAVGIRNREKIIDALIALVVEGRAGTIEEIVERSGVARRSIFRHFTDLSDLMLAAMGTVLAKAAPLAIVKDIGVGPLDRRIESFVDARLRTLALWHPFRSGANARLSELDAVKAAIKATTEMLRVQISEHFAAELRAIRPAEREIVVDALYVLTSYESYDVSVTQLGRSVKTIRASWRRSIDRLLVR